VAEPDFFTPDGKAGECVQIADNIRLVRADNPGPFTGAGTNSWIIGRGNVALIDPGPDDVGHLTALLNAIGLEERITHIFLTHSHADHSALTDKLVTLTGGKVHAYPRPTTRHQQPHTHTSTDALTIDEPASRFTIAHALTDGELIEGDSWRLRCHYTPGHMDDHFCFAMGEHLFTGDLIMPWSSSIISPPEGNLGHYMASLAQMDSKAAWLWGYPGHGAPFPQPNTRINTLIAHRKAREAEIVSLLNERPARIAELTPRLYAATPKHLWPAAACTIFAHLHLLHESGKVVATPVLHEEALFSLVL